MKTVLEIVKNTVGADGYHFTTYGTRKRHEQKVYSNGRLETTNAYTASLWRAMGQQVTERVDVFYTNN